LFFRESFFMISCFIFLEFNCEELMEIWMLSQIGLC